MKARRLVLVAAGALTGWAGAMPACNLPPAEPPCGGVLPFETHPVSHLAAIWRAPGSQPLALGNSLVARGAAMEYMEIDPATGASLRAVSSSSSFSWLAGASRDDLWIGVNETPYVMGLDPASLAVKWKIACSPGTYRCDVRGARAGSVAVFAGIIDYLVGSPGTELEFAL